MFGAEPEDEQEVPAASPPDERARRAPDLDELVSRLERPERRFPIERAILLSLLFHLVLLILFLLHGARVRSLDMMQMARRQEPPPVPIQFYVEAPGPERRNAGRSAPPSNLTRRAGGGKPSARPSETPFVERRAGIEGLAPGERSRRESASGGAASPARPAQTGGAAIASRGGGPVSAPPEGARSAGLPGLSQAIQKAAGALSAGEGGAPLSQQGGFVDSGPVSFDTKWYDWGDYAEEMVRRIKLHWAVPDLARIGVKGKLTIRFYIHKDGTVEAEKILSGSGIPPFDFAAFQAIAKSSPFRPLPAELHEDREGVTVTFFYNIRPGEQ